MVLLIPQVFPNICESLGSSPKRSSGNHNPLEEGLPWLVNGSHLTYPKLGPWIF